MKVEDQNFNPVQQQAEGTARPAGQPGQPPQLPLPQPAPWYVPPGGYYYAPGCPLPPPNGTPPVGQQGYAPQEPPYAGGYYGQPPQGGFARQAPPQAYATPPVPPAAPPPLQGQPYPPPYAPPGYPPVPPQYGYAQPRQESSNNNVMGILSMVLGILSVFGTWPSIYSIFAFLMAGAAIVLGAICVKRAKHNGFAIAGLVVGIVTASVILITFVFFIYFTWIFGYLGSYA